ncbi:MAG TPA: hypothetical protein VMD59_12815, partial [Acidimicrobiales bacterium]|nr:hypothetical protein [Acidimicrobiales bacterium]
TRPAAPGEAVAGAAGNGSAAGGASAGSGSAGAVEPLAGITPTVPVGATSSPGGARAGAQPGAAAARRSGSRLGVVQRPELPKVWDSDGPGLDDPGMN